MADFKFETHQWNSMDVPFLWEMLYASIHVRDGEAAPSRAVLDDPHLSHYLTEFGRYGDDAEIAFDDEGNAIGAAYCRRMRADDPGYGFVSEDIPELGMAVIAEWRSRGVGTRLIKELLKRNPALSLSVDAENVAAERLYARLGFARVEQTGTAWTMVHRA
jgi:GNAT superfamily N-acetyltransferase